MSQGAPTSVSNAQKIDRPAALFDAAMALFEARSYDEVTVDEICARAGVGRATFFRLFGGKAGLLEEANRRTANAIREAVAQGGAEGKAALEIMGDVVRRNWMAGGPAVHQLFIAFMRQMHESFGQDEAAIDANYEGSRALVELAVRFVREGQDAGAFRADLDPDFMGLSFVTQLTSAASFWLGCGGGDPAVYEERVAQSVLVMLHGMARA